MTVGILTEKPSAARNFAKALGGQTGTYNGENYVIAFARGHLLSSNSRWIRWIRRSARSTPHGH